MRPLLLLLAAAALTVTGCEKKDPGDTSQMSYEQVMALAKKNAEEAKAFLAENAKKPGIMTLPSGVQYQVLKSGPTTGTPPTSSDTVQVNYQGALLNGKVFDTTYTDSGATPQTFMVDGLIPAWTEALQQMKPGDEWMLYVPPEQGYGEAGAGADIPPNSALVFKINLVRVIPAGG
jgi:peptidylprolyl isomerase/FKBP-type peptidyl-prolyl cis-trans isomerase FklB